MSFKCPQSIEIENLDKADSPAHYYYCDAFPDGSGIRVEDDGYAWLDLNSLPDTKSGLSLADLMAHIKEVLGRDPIGLKLYPAPKISFLFKSERDRKAMV